MIHAFFNIRLDETYLPERTGQVVRDVAEAREVARTIIRRLVTQHGGEPRLLNAVMAVTDADGGRVLDLSFFEALYVPVAAPAREGTDLRRVATRARGGFGNAFATLAAAAHALPKRLRLGALLGLAAAGLVAAADHLSFRRDPRPRFALGLDPGR